MAKRIPLVFEGGEIIEQLSTDTFEVGNGTLITPGSTEDRILKDRFGDFINVKDYGAEGDGIADDTDAFRKAAVAAAAKGGVVYVPHGTYKVTDPISGEYISFGHPEFIGSAASYMDQRLTDLYDDYVHKTKSVTESITGEKTAIDPWHFMNSETHAGAETHDGARVNNGSGTYNAFQTFNSGTNIKGGLTVNGGATISGGMTVDGSETHNGAGAYNGFQTFNSGTNIKGGATVSGGMTVTGGNISGTCTSALVADNAGHATSADTATNAGHATNADNATNAGTAAACTGNAATATKVGHDLVMKINGGNTEGTNKYTYNGSAGKTLNFSAGSNITMTASEGAVVIAATSPSSVENATTASKLGSQTIGGPKQPIYLSAGSPVEFTSTLGNATQPVYISGGVFKVCDEYPTGGGSGSGGSFSGIATAIDDGAVVTSSWWTSAGAQSFNFPSTGKWLALVTDGGNACDSPTNSRRAQGGHIINVTNASTGYFTTSGTGEGSDGNFVNITAIKLA